MKKLLQLYTQTFAVWVVLFGVVAYFVPGPFVALKSANKLFFSLTMFGIGAILSVEDFKRIAQKPWIVAVGTMTQFVVMPLGAWALARALRLPPEMAVGFVLAGCVPGAMASNVMSYVAKADTAYSVSLTTVSTLLCPLLTPALTKLLAGSVMEVPLGKMVLDVLLMVVVPLAIGFLVRHLFSRQVEAVRELFPALSVTFIVFICALVIALNRERFGQTTFLVVSAGVLLNLYGMFAGYGVAALFRMQEARRRTLSIEVGMQNAGLGTVLALSHFGEKAAISTAVFVFICIITASIMAEVWRVLDERRARIKPPQ